MLIHPSLLAADFSKLDQEIASVEPYADGLHFDVMDGWFVPNTTPLTAQVLKNIKTTLPVEVHLMVMDPENYIPDFLDAGARFIAFHVETNQYIVQNIEMIKQGGAKAGLAINPETNIESLDLFLDILDYVLVMSVHPGKGGQTFIPEVLEKVAYLKTKRPNLQIVIDGGINAITAPLAKAAGVDILVAGTAIFQSKNREEAVRILR